LDTNKLNDSVNSEQIRLRGLMSNLQQIIPHSFPKLENADTIGHQ